MCVGVYVSCENVFLCVSVAPESVQTDCWPAGTDQEIPLRFGQDHKDVGGLGGAIKRETIGLL